jgi:hypothetical protein
LILLVTLEVAVSVRQDKPKKEIAERSSPQRSIDTLLATERPMPNGMESMEVTAILGSPDRCDDLAGFKSCTWGDAKSHVIVRFAGNKAILHSAENIR